MNISKASKLIVVDKDGKIICNIEIGMASLETHTDKSKVLRIKQAK